MLGKNQLVSTSALTLAVLCALLLVAAQPAHAQTETVLYSFAGSPGDGAIPSAGLVMDKKGNLYGNTYGGGPNNYGTVFKLTPAGTETVLYSFTGANGDGTTPMTGLVMDKKGNLYGTTNGGGANGWGTVFELTPAGKETVLHSFTGYFNGDGVYPQAGLVMDKLGNLYGTTYQGGANNYGTVFKLTPAGTETVLYSFTGSNGDGANPWAGLVMDKNDNLYGTTYQGGTNNYGTVFKLTPAGTETVLYSFTGSNGDGAYPEAGVVMDKKGNLYGTTVRGANGYGTVFKLSLSKKGAWTETVLYSFTDNGGDGAWPLAGVVMDKLENLYGTTVNGGANNDGTVFKLTPAGTETVLYSFTDSNGDGEYPVAGGLVMDKNGNLYGTTEAGGTNGYGTVFKVTP